MGNISKQRVLDMLDSRIATWRLQSSSDNTRGIQKRQTILTLKLIRLEIEDIQEVEDETQNA